MKNIIRIAFLVSLMGFAVGLADHSVTGHRKTRGLMTMAASIGMMAFCLGALVLLNTQKRNAVASAMQSVRDYFWVIRAFFLGKILRQKSYRPETQGEFLSFSAPPGATATRMATLIRWWGGRLVTTAELRKILRAESRKRGGLQILHTQDQNPFISFRLDEGRVACDPNSDEFRPIDTKAMFARR